MAEAKHSFVDDNPYIVYSPNAETTSEGGSGGLVVVTADADGYPSMSAEEIAENANAGKLVVYKIMQGDSSFELLYLQNCTYGEHDAALFTNILATPDGIKGESALIQTKTEEVTIFTYPSGD